MKTLTTLLSTKIQRIYSFYNLNRIFMLSVLAFGIFNFSMVSSQNNYCSGTKTYTAAQGVITDGSGQSSPYNGNSDCKFLIKPAGALSISLYVNDFDTETNYDFVHIYDGETTNATLLGTYSGSKSNIPTAIYSTGGTMLLHFVSDNLINGDGFEFDYEATIGPWCMGTTTLTNTSGVFNDGSGTANYDPNSDCKWLISPANTTDITIDFSWIELENNYDYIYIYDGNSTSANLLATYTGSHTNTTPVTSTGGEMLIHFSSDNLVNKDGFEATWTSNQIPAFCNGTTNLTASSGTFDDGSGNTTKYQNNANCKWLIQPAGATSVTLDFTYIQLTGMDYVYVYDGNNINAPLLGTFNGYNTSSLPLAMTSTGGEILVHFITNSSYTDFGWEANYTSVIPNNSQACNGTTNLTSPSGVFNDGSGSANYGSNSDCKWLISPANTSDITISFSWVEVENNYDFIKVYDGNSVNAPLLATYSGSHSSTSPVTSTGGEMLVHFTSDNLVNKDGFEATWTSNQNSSSGGITSCTGQTTLTATSGMFSDGSGTQNYDPNSDCKWLIDVSGASSISLDFTSFEVENNYDFVTVYDGSTTNASVLATLTGNSLPAKINSTGNQMLVHFTSDNIVNKAGWEAVYTGIIPVTGGGNGNFCSGTMTYNTPSGAFSDGSGSSDYAPNSDCKWLISPANAFSIILTFNQLDIENGYDFVKVYDGNSVNAPLLGSFTGNTLPSNITSSGGEMLVHFESDNIVNKSGFDVTYSSTTTPSGAIDNQGYCTELTTFTLPAGSFHDGSGSGIDYLSNTHCLWLIQPNQADTIILTFISYMTEFNYDFIKVYDGPTVNSPLIDVISGTGIFKKVESYSGSMLVEFVSDDLYNDAGFLAIYSTKTFQNGGATAAPIADFMASAVNVNVGDAVSFFDISQNNPNSWNWIFVNGSAPTSSKQNPTGITYNTPGCYEVHLTASNNLGTDQTSKKCYINVNALVGLGEGEEWIEEDVKVFPNPNEGKFSLYFNPEKDKQTKVTISNMLGEIVYENIVSDRAEFDEEINLEEHGKGVYFVNIHNGEKVISKRIVVD